MIVTPIPDRGVTAIRDALQSHGLEGEVCRDMAVGAEAVAFHVTGVDDGTIEGMLPVAARLGLELITGPDWLIVAGAGSRLGAFARPWVQPEAVRALATAIGMALPFELPRTWRHATGTIDLDPPVMIGVLNITPDSFSDAARYLAVDAALRQADTLLAGGAAIIDIGGESTGPAAHPVDASVEEARVMPVIDAIARRHPATPLSVDTTRGDTARRAVDAGASIINDVSAGRHDPSILEAARSTGAALILSHSRGAPGTIASYEHADHGGDVTGSVLRELLGSVEVATAAGVARDRIVIDPGFGFGKLPGQNFRLLDDLDAFVRLGFPVLAGVSRKRFLGDAADRSVDDRDRATAAACAIAVDRGATLLRIHDPAAVRDAIAIAHAVCRSRA